MPICRFQAAVAFLTWLLKNKKKVLKHRTAADKAADKAAKKCQMDKKKSKKAAAKKVQQDKKAADKAAATTLRGLARVAKRKALGRQERKGRRRRASARNEEAIGIIRQQEAATRREAAAAAPPRDPEHTRIASVLAELHRSTGVEIVYDALVLSELGPDHPRRRQLVDTVNDNIGKYVHVAPEDVRVPLALFQHVTRLAWYRVTCPPCHLHDTAQIGLWGSPSYALARALAMQEQRVVDAGGAVLGPSVNLFACACCGVRDPTVRFPSLESSLRFLLIRVILVFENGQVRFAVVRIRWTACSHINRSGPQPVFRN